MGLLHRRPAEVLVTGCSDFSSGLIRLRHTCPHPFEGHCGWLGCNKGDIHPLHPTTS